MDRDDLITFLPIIVCFLVLIGCIGSLFGFAAISARLDCNGIAVGTGLETKWQLFGGCFVKVNGDWLPLDVWKAITIYEGTGT